MPSIFVSFCFKEIARLVKDFKAYVHGVVPEVSDEGRDLTVCIQL